MNNIIDQQSRSALEDMVKSALSHPTDAMVRLAITHAYQLGKIDGAVAGADNIIAALTVAA